MPTRPLRLFLVRHGQSAANLDKSMNVRLPDHSIQLSPEGHEQALAAGHALAGYLSASAGPGPIRILCSPYERTRQTSAAIEAVLKQRGLRYDKREAVELRELEFGLFDGVPDEEMPLLFPREYEHYNKHVRVSGEFFAQMPQGESRCQVAERVKGVFGTLLRDAAAGRADCIRDFVLVTHGVTLRCIRMQWMHYLWEWFQEQPNPNNASIQVIEGVPGKGYRDFLMFEGFMPPRRSPQARREEGVVGPMT
jgi:2,3-bisphosphoglycerate-dependent phosphoglycerate mutase